MNSLLLLVLLDVIVELGKGLDGGKLSLRNEHTVLGLYYTNEVNEAQAVELKGLVDGGIGSDGSLIDFKLLCQFGVNLLNDNIYNIMCKMRRASVQTFFTMMVELVPPKPKLLERNMSKCCCLVSGSTLRQAVTSSGFSKLMLPAMKSFFIIRME